MTDIQKKLLELLTDMDAICKRENIKYYLCDETAHGAIMEQNLYKNCCQLNVAMTPDNVRKFIEAVKKENREDRIVDSMMTNKSYLDYAASYADPKTTMMELPYAADGKKPCIGVTIHIIRFKPKSLRKYYKITKKMWEVCHMNANEYPTFFKKAAIIACKAVRTIVGEANLGRILFKSWCTVFSKNKKAAKFAIGTSKYSFDSSLLKQDGTAILAGKEFPVFGDMDTYLNKKYGCEDFRQKKPKCPVPSATTMISCHISYDEYVKKATEMGVDFEDIYQKRKKVAKLEKKVSQYNKKINKYYAIVDRTEKRFAMYEKYIPMKKLLIQLYEEKRYEELNELLKPYRSALWACYKKGLGLCFDKEIFEMTMHILSMEGQDSYVAKVRDLVPESHWEPMVVTDYKGELVEIKDISEVLTGEVDTDEEF